MASKPSKDKKQLRKEVRGTALEMAFWRNLRLPPSQLSYVLQASKRLQELKDLIKTANEVRKLNDSSAIVGWLKDWDMQHVAGPAKIVTGAEPSLHPFLALTQDADVLRHFLPFRKFSRNGLSGSVSFFQACSMTLELQEWTYQLCKHNMHDLYLPVWGWNEKKKRRELKDVSVCGLLVQLTT